MLRSLTEVDQAPGPGPGVSGETVLVRSWNSRSCSIQAPAPVAASSSASFLARPASSTAYSASPIAE
jgi:hypothetical protein